jgi:ribonuclease E
VSYHAVSDGVTGDGVGEDPVSADRVELAAAPSTEPVDLDPAHPVATAPARRGRRHRGRVVAPAGPPRSGAAHGPDGPASG